jgi:ribonuclease M5
MMKIREVIVVEGRYDKNAVRQAVDAAVIETDGFGIFSDDEKVALLRRLAEKRGLIILTDGDSAGFLIRGHLKGRLGGLNIRHAYVPDIRGREKRKRTASKEGKLGVEGMSRDVIIAALVRAGATPDDESIVVGAPDPIKKADMYAAGLSGTPGSAERRAALLRRLSLPERLTPNGLLEVLNALYSREEFFSMAAQPGNN